MDEHQCIHEEDWGSVKTSVRTILAELKEIKALCKPIGAMQVKLWVQWVLLGGLAFYIFVVMT